jgi:Arc/MetJ-type ribon-helix-helix transcriptional regulator
MITTDPHDKHYHMQITLPDKLEHIIQTYINSGKYQNAVEVLVAGVKLLEREEIPANMTFGILDEQNQFSPLIESAMIQASLQVLENHQHDTMPHTEVERWVDSLTI